MQNDCVSYQYYDMRWGLLAMKSYAATLAG